MAKEVSLATVVNVPLEVTADDACRLSFIGTDSATAAFLTALVSDDMEAAASSVARTPTPPGWTPEQMRAEIADRVAHVVRQLVNEGLVRIIGGSSVWRADFTRIRQRLYGPR